MSSLESLVVMGKSLTIVVIVRIVHTLSFVIIPAVSLSFVLTVHNATFIAKTTLNNDALFYFSHHMSAMVVIRGAAVDLKNIFILLNPHIVNIKKYFQNHVPVFPYQKRKLIT